jgi:hypothetical protein
MTFENEYSPLSPIELAELKRLIAISSDRGLDAEESAQIEKILASSREARSIYIGYMQLDAALDWKVRGHNSLDDVVEKSRCVSALLTRPDSFEQLLGSGLKRKRLLSLMALAASIVVIASVAWFAHRSLRNNKSAVAANESAANNDSPVATIVPLSKECNWFVENRRNAESTVRAGDNIRLTRGQLRMDFACGASVTMRSPAALEIISPTRTRAVLGTLKAHVGKGAEGFTVETPRTTVVDLGTDFGIDVSRHGTTDVVVFNGMVDLHSDGISGLNDRQRLRAGEGVRVSGDGTASRIVSILDSQFSMADARPARDRTPVISEVRDNIRRGESWYYYEIVHGGMHEDAKAFVDREHEWNGQYAVGMPRYLLGADYVKTFNDDKVNRQVEMRVTISRPAILYVLLDKRSPVPDWLRSRFFNTGDEIGLDGGKYTRFGERKSVGVGAGTSIDDAFSVWRLDVPEPETVTLGAIETGGETHNMYGIAAVPMEVRENRDDFAGVIGHPSQKSTPLKANPDGNLTIDGSIDRPQDIDMFRFDWMGGVAEVACLTSGYTTLDPVLSVYDAQESLVGFMRAPRIGREKTAVKMNLPAGTYYVGVTGNDEVGEVGSYHVDVGSATAEVAPPLPAAPSLVLTGSPINGGVQLSWTGDDSTSSYIIEQSADAVSFEPLTTTTEHTFEATIDPGRQAIYRIRAEEVGGPASAPVLYSAPAPAVTRLQAFGSSPQSIVLEWRDVRRERGYRVERSTGGAPFEKIGSVSQNACGYRDSNVNPGSQYTYRVTTLNASGQDFVTEPITAMSGVANLTAMVVNNDIVVLNWKANHPKARFFVERSTGGPDTFVTIGAVMGDTETFVDETVVVGEEPRYRVVTVEDVSDLTPSRTEPCERVEIPDWTSEDHRFALRYAGKLHVEKRGKYYLYLTSDDGSRLFLDGALVVNNDEKHSEQTVCGTIELEAGIHDLEAQYFEADGNKRLEFAWAGPLAHAEVPSDVLSSLTVSYYPGDWLRLPFSRSCAVSDVVQLTKPAASTKDTK